MKFFISILVLIILSTHGLLPGSLWGSDTGAQPKKQIAIFDFIANNVPTAYSRIVRNAIEVSLFAADQFRLIERERISKLLKERNISKISGSDTSRIISLGKSLATDFIIVGSLDHIEDYKIVIRVVSVKEGRIIVAYSKSFSSAGDIDDIAEKLSRKVSKDLVKYISTGKIKAEFYDSHRIILGFRFHYIYPVQKFGELINPGSGITVSGGVENLFFDNSIFGIGFGYFNFTGKKNVSDQCTFKQLFFNIGYRYPILRKLSLFPSLSAGMVFVTSSHGTGNGFAMKDNSEKTEIEPMFHTGIALAFVPSENLHIMFGLQYGFIYEPESIMDYISLNLGAQSFF